MSLPELVWNLSIHPYPPAIVTKCEETTCGLYRRYRMGTKGNFVGAYLPETPGRYSIFIEDTLEKLMDRIDNDRRRRAVLAAKVGA